MVMIVWQMYLRSVNIPQIPLIHVNGFLLHAF
jgi:hypothetical protein